MVKIHFLTLVCLFFFVVYSVILPVNLGEDKIGIFGNESYSELNLFDFSANPAWMHYARKSDYIQFLSSSSNTWGNLRRRFDPEGYHTTNLGFSGITQIDEKSTFFGKSSYVFDLHSRQNRSLKYDTYSGEAFFMTDSTKGNILYHGHEIGFIYSREIIPGMAGGLELNYAIIDGMKSNYSQAQSLIRKISGKLGLTYSFSDNLVWGTTLGFGDTQESIEVQGNDLYSVDIYNFRGDTYSILSRGSDINQKIRKKGVAFGSGIYAKISGQLDFLMEGEYSDYHLTNLISDIETKDGYAVFETYRASLALNYNFSRKVIIANKLNYNYSRSWSEHSILDLLLWKWHTGNLNYSLNISYKSNNPDVIFDIDYSANYISADSSKYIDKKFNNINAVNHFIMLGTVYKLFGGFQVCNNMELGIIKVDPLTGQRNFLEGGFNIRTGFALTPKIYALVNVGYLIESNSKNSVSRKNFNSVVVLQISK